MAQTILNVPLSNLPSGTTTITSHAVASWVTGVLLQFARCTTPTPTVWPSATQTISGSFDFSFDGGVTWELGLFQFSMSGGIVKDSSGNEIGTGVVGFNHNPTPTHVRGTVTVTNGPINSSVTVQVN